MTPDNQGGRGNSLAQNLHSIPGEHFKINCSFLCLEHFSFIVLYRSNFCWQLV